MRVAVNAKRDYKGELLTIRQWEKKGYKPKPGEKPEQMWANQNCCGSSTPGRHIFDYYYDYLVEKVEQKPGKDKN